MHEDPLLLIPMLSRQDVLDDINSHMPDGRRVKL
ncbi:MAG: hypothetical protein JWM57_2726, partial [Phycisphaerales bacterium]|nr:hypothetical protein [Phycisphaerales bacterium]